jgi:hypothetical protein
MNNGLTFQCASSAVMDYKCFEQTMELAGKALFLGNDTERCMQILQSIINKFDPQR